MRMLFIGDVTPYLTTAARRDAFIELGLDVETLDSRRSVRTGHRMPDLLSSWTLMTPQVRRFNRAVLERARAFQPDVVWIEKGIHVMPRTLARLRASGHLLVYHNTDDWKARTRLHRLQWRYLLDGLSLYDVHVTSNLHNVEEFRRLGFSSAHHMELAANPAIRDPGELDPATRRELGAPVGFIGHWEPATESLLRHLVRAGVELKIYGPNWERCRARETLAGALQDRSVWGEEYARAICSFDVNLGIVSKWNRNHTASRTFQIPALGAFMLHERNELVTRYFKEGSEAEFFSSPDELLRKTLFYLANPDERLRIARAGRRRCHESGYFEPDRVRELLPVLEAGARTARRRGVASGTP